MYLPFIGLILAALLYYVFYKLNNSKKFLIYQNALILIKIFSLVLGYASVNYMVVRELSESIMFIVVREGDDIPLAFLFYGLTFLIPLAYIYYSLYSKDKLMLIIGFLTFGFSIYTIRFYYHILPVEVALLLGGTILCGIAYLAIRKLKDKETGITFKEARGSETDVLTNLQALVVNSQVDVKPMESNSKMPFGGGGFSGGGAGESF